MFEDIVVGAGYAGAVCARRIAQEAGRRVLLLEKRSHIAGNMYDTYNADGILVHQYGPHISVMNEERVFRFLSRFTQWVPYHHTVRAEIDGVIVPLPFNLTSIDLLFPVEEAVALKEKLIGAYGFDANIPILELRRSEDAAVKKLAEYIYEKVFVHYTMKMWGLSPDEIDPSVTARIPVRISYDNKHFLQKYQVMPKDGFTKLFESLLNHPNITIQTGTDALDVVSLDESSHTVLYKGEKLKGNMIYTGAIDELLQNRYGSLPYRSLEFQWETHGKDFIQEETVRNWPDQRPATRRTEMKRLTGQKLEGRTSLLVEYPGEYKKGSARFGEPYYPIDREECRLLHQKYLSELSKYRQIIPVGRLADYKYYNMEAVILRAFEVSDKLVADTARTK